MRKILPLFARLGPWVVIFFYSVLNLGYYGRHLDRGLVYAPGAVLASREDVLGFGFLMPWLLFFTVWLMAEVLACQLIHKHSFIFSVIAFSLVSALDFWLFYLLEKQVPGYG